MIPQQLLHLLQPILHFPNLPIWQHLFDDGDNSPRFLLSSCAPHLTVKGAPSSSSAFFPPHSPPNLQIAVTTQPTLFILPEWIERKNLSPIRGSYGFWRVWVSRIFPVAALLSGYSWALGLSSPSSSSSSSSSAALICHHRFISVFRRMIPPKNPCKAGLAATYAF